MACNKLRCPQLVVGACRERLLPNVRDVQGTTNHTTQQLSAEQPLEQILVEREQALREDGISELLQFIENPLVQARVVMIGTTEHHQPNSTALFEVIESPASLPAQVVFKFMPFLKSNVD